VFGRLAAAVLAVVAALLMATRAGAASYVPSGIEPPWVTREFRGVWIATVANLDWPSSPGLPVEQQKEEMRRILDRAVQLKLNAVIFQARPIGDALYDSQIEPWSYYLTGVMGRPPSPWYDPLAFTLAEAHRRGLELHVWFSPYRVGPPTGSFPMAKTHITRTRPDLVRKVGTQLWLDPGEREVQDYTLRVIMDVVRRYDIDGVHFDDRLGYPEPDPQRRTDFPDAATYLRYGKAGGKLGRDDWRRENINQVVQRVYAAVKAAKPWVKVGIAPFGIWENGVPAQIKGQSAYSVLYTDSRKWLMNGWLDYCAPQLYWPMGPPTGSAETSFPVLLNWWREQNTQHRNLWPGLYTVKAGDAWPAEEIAGEIRTVRDQSGSAAGEIHFSASVLMNNKGGIAAALANGVYARPALVPSSPWLEQTMPGKPSLRVENGRAFWEPAAGTNRVAVWLLQTRSDGQWQTRILAGEVRGQLLTATDLPEAVALTEIDRCGVASPAAVMQREPGERK
jgi:uncharacterized lipoprotein YddW (UPF0748 family)